MNQNSYTKKWYSMTDKVIIETMCSSLKQMRLNLNMSQEELSEKSGLSRITISRMENGQSINMLSYIQALRALKNLDLLNELIIEPEISPIAIMTSQEKNLRKKASPKKNNE